MDRYEEIAAELEKQAFKIELHDCVVKRCSDTKIEEYLGTGTIEQDEEGNLHFKMETTQNFDALINRLGGHEELESGKIIPLSALFVVTGKDQHGGIWESSATLINADMNVIEERATIKLRPNTWKLKQEADPDLIQKKWKVSGKLRPFSFGKFGVTTQQDSFEDDAWSVKTNQATNVHSFTYTAANGDELETRAQHLNKGWSVLCGCPLQPYIMSVIQDGVETIKITKVHHGLDRNKLYPFIDPRGRKIYDHLDFIRCWLGTPKRFQEQLKAWEAYTGHKAKKGRFESPLEDIFQHFYRVQFAFNMDMENAVQVLTSAVEGIINKHCKDFMDGDNTILEPIANAQPFIDGIKDELDERVLKIIQSALSRASAPTTKAVLKRLVEQEIISEALMKKWEAARNSPAHGTLLKHGDDEETQDHLDGFFYSYEIFKRLIFCLIGYQGSHNNLEKRGWPSEAWPPALMESKP
ncbi:hypothetical protein B9Y60_10585 [Stenotrophomonas maltophilia]|uniref:hypothetical protein n=1 Tax=Stenotrophomonas maltophilia TaxID=40324 RepID=UPI000C262D2D|nr:hypothetical protein [Stenotrophomonas maltophilia]PJL52201.1 hypothetical protein B9Y73_10585 [Stenotrophomonas maltophilia]PJL55122.1 hypothetical protein B9Y60_10585 [Stenotrophomonas maltophilia]